MFKNKIVLVTGGTGSFGNAVVTRLLKTNVSEIRIFSRDEKKHKIKNLLIKIISCELFLIKTIFLTIFLTNSQPTVYSVLLAISAAIYFSWPLLFAAIQIGIHVRDGYYEIVLSEKKSPLMEFLKPWAEIKIVEATEESIYY